MGVALSSNGLKGSVPDSISKLHALEVLQLDGNELEGAVPSTFAEMSVLQMIHLQNNKLSGPLPPTMINLTVAYPSLQEIDLSYNQISGSIPETIFGPEKVSPFDPSDPLKVLNLRYNQVSGQIPSRITRAAKMLSILLGGNNMTGTIASDLGPLLTARKYCDLTGNAWSCPLPDGVADKCQ